MASKSVLNVNSLLISCCEGHDEFKATSEIKCCLQIQIWKVTIWQQLGQEYSFFCNQKIRKEEKKREVCWIGTSMYL